MRVKLVLYSFIILLLFFGVGANFWYFRGVESLQTAKIQSLEQILASNQRAIGNLQLASVALLAENQTVANRLESEKEKRVSAELAQRVSTARLNLLEKEVANNQITDLTNIVSSWRPRVAALKCQWSFSSGARATSGGSAVLIPQVSLKGGVALLTNKHIVDYQGLLPSTCSIQFPSQNMTYSVEASDISIAPTTDSAIIEIANPGAFLTSLNSAKLGRCSSNGRVGDTIIILGYPNIGSRSDITATEGIISGYENGYYLSSAKVERGNSGGAAVLAKSNCYLGIPSFVDVGQIESLARILDQKTI